MLYDIVKNMAALAASGANLKIKLRNVAWLFLENFHFDQCSIYLQDESGGGFSLAAFAGEDHGRVEHYEKGEGVAYYVTKDGTGVEVYTRDKADIRWKRTRDRGLEGFRNVFVMPLMDGSRCYGVLYLKSFKKVALKADKRRALDIALIQLVSLLKFSEIILDYKEVVSEVGDARMKLLNAKRMVHLGDMAAALTHELKNPLISLGAYASRIRRSLKDDSPVVAYVDRMIKEVDRLEKLIITPVRSLREELNSRKIDDINKILEDSLVYFTDDFTANGIYVEKDFFKGKLMVAADREELKIAFDNLIANAIQSMNKGGTLRLSTLLSDSWVVTEVTDSGGGINHRNIASIFTPFFTTKKDGTGLGLAITSSIIMRHEGVIDVQNRVGEGVTFKVKLPLAGTGKTKVH